MQQCTLAAAQTEYGQQRQREKREGERERENDDRSGHGTKGMN